MSRMTYSQYQIVLMNMWLDGYVTDSEYYRISDRIVKTEQTEQTEPQTCEECEHWGDIEDGCADRHGCKTEPLTCRNKEFYETCEYSDNCNQSVCHKAFDEFSRMLDEATGADEPQTERSE